MPRSWAVVLLLGGALALAALPAASAVPLAADLQVRGPATFVGDGNLTAAWTGAMHDARLRSAGPLGPLRVSGEATLETHWFAVEQSPEGSAPGHEVNKVPVRDESRPLGAFDGPLVLQDAGTNASVRLLPDRPAQVRLSGGFDLTAPVDLHRMLGGFTDGEPYETSAPHYPSLGALRSNATGLAPREYDGAVLLTDVVVLAGGDTIDTRWQAQGAGVPGQASGAVLQVPILVVHGRIAHEATPQEAWIDSLAALDGALDGDLLLRNAEGKAAVEQDQATGFHLFQAVGTLQVHADLTREAAAWHVEGDADFVAVNAQALAGQRWGWLATAAAGAGALAALVLLAKALRPLSAWLSGLNVAEPTSSPRRLDILRLISQQPGITLRQISRGAGIGRAATLHHLRVLAHGHLITRRQVGNASSFTLDNATFDFPDRPGSPRLAGEALGHFAHPVRREILHALEALGAASYEDMRRHWEAHGVRAPSRTTVGHHCRLLLRRGLLERHAAGRRAQWRLLLDRPAAVGHQARAYVRQGSYREILVRLAEGPATEERLADRMRRAGKPIAARDLRKSLLVLEATGYVQRIADGYEVPDAVKPSLAPAPRGTGIAGTTG